MSLKDGLSGDAHLIVKENLMAFVTEFKVRIEGWGNPRTVYAHSDGSEISLQIKVCKCEKCDERESAIREVLNRKEGIQWKFEDFWIHAITVVDTGVKAGEELERQFEENIKGKVQHPIRGKIDDTEFRQRAVEYLSSALGLRMDIVQ